MPGRGQRAVQEQPLRLAVRMSSCESLACYLAPSAAATAALAVVSGPKEVAMLIHS